MAEFRFKLGECVYLVTGIVEAMQAAKLGLCTTPVPLIVVGRLSEECSGGVQLLYNLGVIGVNGRVLRFHESEVAPMNDWDCDMQLDAFISAANRLKDAGMATPVRATRVAPENNA